MLFRYRSGIHFLNEQVLNAAEVNLSCCRVHRVIERQVAAFNLVEQAGNVNSQIRVTGSFEVAVYLLTDTYSIFQFKLFLGYSEAK